MRVHCESAQRRTGSAHCPKSMALPTGIEPVFSP
jgi:hypothetical protein